MTADYEEERVGMMAMRKICLCIPCTRCELVLLVLCMFAAFGRPVVC